MLSKSFPECVKYFFTLSVVVLTGCMQSSPEKTQDVHAVTATTSADYDRANDLLSRNFEGRSGNILTNEINDIVWQEGEKSFTYRRNTPTGNDYLLVDAKTGAVRPAFDHGALAASLAKALKKEVTAQSLPILKLRDKMASLSSKSGLISCDLTNGQCAAKSKSKSKPVRRRPGTLKSPDGGMTAFVRHNNIWLREGQSGKETALTEDGAADFIYGVSYGQFAAKAKMRGAENRVPMEGLWSPDSRFLIVPRLDVREVVGYPYLKMLPRGGSLRPVAIDLKFTLPADHHQPKVALFIFNRDSGKLAEFHLPGKYEPLQRLGASHIGWSSDSKYMFMVAATPGNRHVALLKIDISNGSVETVIEESAKDSVYLSAVFGPSASNIKLLQGGKQVIWFSERSGWGHFYRYDTQSGKLLNAITGGDWVALEILYLDEKRARLYFSAGGREAGSDPYYRKIYRVGLDGSDLTLLTPEEADHAPLTARGSFGRVTPINFSSSGLLLIDTYSTVDEVPVSVLRSVEDGHVIVELEMSDPTALYARGYRPPVRFSAKAADGTTDIYGTFYYPRDFDPKKKYPVVDVPYGGPITNFAPRNYKEGYQHFASTFTALGFVAVVIDGRGMPGRSREFSHVGYGGFTKIHVDDQVAAIRQLGQRYEFLDMDRIGTVGHSWAGSTTAQAILSYPDFYKAAVSSAGLYDYSTVFSSALTTIYAGLPVYKNGLGYSDDPAERAEIYEKQNIIKLAGNLKGKLLIIYGEHDLNVPPVQAFGLINALIKANKDFDVLPIPNGTHGLSFTPYYNFRVWSYMVEHLKGVKADAWVSN